MRKIVLSMALVMMEISIPGRLFAQEEKKKLADTNLKNIRKKINSLGKKLFEVLGARVRVVRTIGIYKAQKNIPPLQSAVFNRYLIKGGELEKESLSTEFVTDCST